METWENEGRNKAGNFGIPNNLFWENSLVSFQYSVFSVQERWSLTMAYSSFEELEVWKRSCRLAVTVYQTLEACKDFGLRDQMQRASVSIASNIAEGCERGGKDFARFLRIAQGSAAELRTQVYIARKIQIIAEEPYLAIIDELKQISKMLTGLRRSLKTDP